MRLSLPSPPTSLGRGAQTRRVPPGSRRMGALQGRQPEPGYSCVYPSLGRGVTPQITHLWNERELPEGQPGQAFLITGWGSGNHRLWLGEWRL